MYSFLRVQAENLGGLLGLLLRGLKFLSILRPPKFLSSLSGVLARDVTANTVDLVA